MRDHNKAFVELAAGAFVAPGPVYEFGSYQVEGQEEYANLRKFFGGREYVGCDFREGPGVDRVEDVTRISLGDGCAGTVLCIETFEHVYEVHRAFDEVFRILKPGGMFLITSPFNFRIHAYPDDYWRMTPACLGRRMSGYDARVWGYQGHSRFPHTVMAMGFKAPAPIDFRMRAEAFTNTYHAWLRKYEAERTAWTRAKSRLSGLFRSRAERAFDRDYNKADFQIEQGPAVALAKVG